MVYIIQFFRVTCILTSLYDFAKCTEKPPPGLFVTVRRYSRSAHQPLEPGVLVTFAQRFQNVLKLVSANEREGSHVKYSLQSQACFETP